MSKISLKVLKLACRFTLAVTFFHLTLPILMAQSLLESATDVSVNLALKPTSLVISPTIASAEEGGAIIEFTATAQYDYPSVLDPIAPKDVTADPNTIWGIDNPDVALVNTIGDVTPVSDLGQGSANARVTATYVGKSASADITVTGIIVIPPPVGSGGGGGSLSGLRPPTEGGEPVVNNPPEETTPPVEGASPPVEENVPTQVTNPPEEQTAPPLAESSDSSNTQPGPIQNPEAGPIQGPTIPVTQPSSDNGYLPFVQPLTPTEIKPVSEVFDVNELTELLPPTEKTGVSRAFVTARIADKLKVLELRKDMLDKCYADLENCTNIFRMFSTFKDISVDPANVRLFPDLDNVPEKETIEKMAMLGGIVQGYYGIENSPFLPDKAVSRVETLKIMSSIVALLEKSNPDYVAPSFDYTATFYQEIYAASLIAKIEAAPSAVVSMIKIAHALTDEAAALIKAQRTYFSDVRPDLYDAHWYYPIVYNKICGLKILGCTEGTEAKPDESPSPLEVDLLIGNFDKYITAQNLGVKMGGDEDIDGVSNIDENIIYLTNPKNADTDIDSLKDGQELSIFKTDPNKSDTDDDSLSDGDEVQKYKTDPNLYDTDDDSFSDAVEINAGSDPLKKESLPDDKNANRVADVWETKYNVVVVDGSQDTDEDGVADIIEYKYGTDPTRIDTDMDGYTDNEEILDLQSDPVDPLSPGDLGDLPVLINNFQYGQFVADPSPMIKGVGPASLGDNIVQIQVLLRNEFGSELMLGSTETDAKGRFVFLPDIEIKDGTYFLLARSINKGQVQLSKPIKIVIDSTLDVASANPEKLENAAITEEVLLKNLTLKVDSEDGQPVLYGNLSEFGSRVNVTWQSLVVSSALIADTTDGSFSMKSPKLPEGRHVVYIQTVRKKDNALSRTIRINFTLGFVSTAEAAALKNPSSGGFSSLAGAPAAIVDFVTKQSWPFWVAVVVVVVLVGGGVYVFALGGNEQKVKRKRK